MAVTIALRCILELVIRFLAPDHFAAKNVNIQYRACLTKKEQSALKAFFLPVHELLAKDSYALFSLLFVAFATATKDNMQKGDVLLETGFRPAILI
jgi:hypothetical protein